MTKKAIIISQINLEINNLDLKPSLDLELLVDQFNHATPKMVMTLTKFLHPYIMTLRKCITLNYVTKINHYSHSM